MEDRRDAPGVAVCDRGPPFQPNWGQMFILERTTDDAEELLVREWRAGQLVRLGISATFAYVFADLVDWHDVLELVERGCPPDLAFEIVR